MTDMQSLFAGRRVLLVEDNHWIAEDLVPKLKALGLVIVGPAPNEHEALSHINATPELAAAILGVGLQGKWAYALADELTRRKVPLVFATGYERDMAPSRFRSEIFVPQSASFAAMAQALVEISRRRPAPRLGPGNRILAHLDPLVREAIASEMEPVTLKIGMDLERPQEPLEHVYFLHSGIASVIATSPNGLEIEAGIVGPEGVVGTSLAEGDDRTPHRTTVQIAGEAERMPAAAFVRRMREFPDFCDLSRRFARTMSIQVAYTALANGSFKIEQRLARWLLMINDRLADDRIALTHEYLAKMLGVRRPGVTVALHILEGEGAIRSLRGQIILRDRQKLLQLAEGAYQASEAEFERIMGFPIHPQ